LRQDPADLEAFVPTPAMLAGDFTAFASPQCNNNRQINLRAPFVGNRVNPALYSRAALAIANKLPKSNDPCGRLVYGRTTNNDDAQYVGKVDYQRNANDSIFGRVLFSSSTRSSGRYHSALRRTTF
jgi:hypothetical protein